MSSSSSSVTLQDFQLQDLVGEGSFSSVYRALQLSTQKIFALKILDKAHIIKEKKVKYVTLEKQVLNILSACPLTIKLFYTFQDASSLYFCLEYAPNGDLLGLIRKYSGLSLDCVRFYALEILVALYHIHSKSVIHRDLKPENILIDEHFHVKITDFGSAKLVTDKMDEPSASPLAAVQPSTIDSSKPPAIITDPTETRKAKTSGSFVGTAEYVSPELLNEKSAVFKSDLWAWACILYQMVVNRPPFKASNDYQIFQRILKLDYSIPSYFPEILVPLIRSILVPDPADRPSIEQIYKNTFFAPFNQEPISSIEIWNKTPPNLTSFIPDGGWTLEMKKEQTELHSINIAALASPISPGLSSPDSPCSPTSEQWKTFLYPGEKIVYSGQIQKKKYFFGKTHTRHLILTDQPRLLYVDPENMVEKGEIPWEQISDVEVKDLNTFSIITPERTYVMNDVDGNAQLWKEVLLKLRFAKDQRP